MGAPSVGSEFGVEPPHAIEADSNNVAISKCFILVIL